MPAPNRTTSDTAVETTAVDTAAPTNTPPAVAIATVPQAGGSFTRQPDGSLVCVEPPTAHSTGTEPSPQ